MRATSLVPFVTPLVLPNLQCKPSGGGPEGHKQNWARVQAGGDVWQREELRGSGQDLRSDWFWKRRGGEHDCQDSGLSPW
jgi:hypothetical protein